MVKRRGYPGKGLWALPGGFLNHRERVIEAAIREATEETGIDVSKTVLRNALVDTFFEDNPWRSTRGRTITFASIFHLKPTPRGKTPARSEEHTSELQSLMRISYAVFCLKKQNIIT